MRDSQLEISRTKQCNPMTPVAFFGGLSHIPGESATGFTRDLGCGERNAWERREETYTPGLRLLHLIQSCFVETCISPCQGPGRLLFVHEGVTLDKLLPGLFDATQSPVPSIVFALASPVRGTRKLSREQGGRGTYDCNRVVLSRLLTLHTTVMFFATEVHAHAHPY